MTHPVDPYVVRRLADCIELLPRYINNPQKMPYVQEVVQRALKQIRFDREALARGHEALTQGEEVEGQLRKGKKYRYELGGAPLQAEKYREPLTVWLSDSDRETLRNGFEEDKTFEVFERLAADIGEWLKEFRSPRDAELFRSELSSVCGEALFAQVKVVEVSPGVGKLDLSSWEADEAKPLCDYLRQFADEIATGGTPPDPLKLELIGPVPDDGFRYKGKVYRGLAGYPWLFLNAVWLAKDQAMRFDDLAEPVYSDAEKFVTYSAINGWQRAVNGFFGAHALPFHMSAPEKTRTAKLVMRPEEIPEKI